MNKFVKILPVAAIVVALAGSAFTSASKQTTVSNVRESALYWHEIIDGKFGPLLNATPQTKSESMPTGSNPITSCDDSEDEVCLQGYTSPRTPGQDAEPVSSNDAKINRD